MSCPCMSFGETMLHVLLCCFFQFASCTLFAHHDHDTWDSCCIFTRSTLFAKNDHDTWDFCCIFTRVENTPKKVQALLSFPFPFHVVAMKAVKAARTSCKKAARAKSGVRKTLRKTPASTQRKTSNGQQRGSKSEPQCTICNKSGHYSIAAVRDSHRSCCRQSVSMLTQHRFPITSPATRMLKSWAWEANLRRLSKDAHVQSPGSKMTSLRKVEKCAIKTNKKKNAKRDRARKPKPKKDLKKVCIDKKATESAYKKLKRDQWLWQPHKCTACFGHLYPLPWATCRLRGRGRLFLIDVMIAENILMSWRSAIFFLCDCLLWS